eukprot:3980_1
MLLVPLLEPYIKISCLTILTLTRDALSIIADLRSDGINEPSASLHEPVPSKWEWISILTLNAKGNESYYFVVAKKRTKKRLYHVCTSHHSQIETLQTLLIYTIREKPETSSGIVLDYIVTWIRSVCQFHGRNSKWINNRI